MKELSSPFTFFYKFIFPLLWFFGFGYGLREGIFAPESFDVRWLRYTATWLGITLFIYLTSGSIKKVSIGENALFVSNFLRTERVDLSRIAAVDGSAYLSPRFVWLVLKDESSFGRKITFFPRHRMSAGLGKHPLIAELREELDL